jgi:hypothetical protein
MTEMNEWLTLEQAAEQFGGIGGRRVARATLWRWCAHGVDGVKLRHTRGIGKGYLVRLVDIADFVKAVADKSVTKTQETE